MSFIDWLKRGINRVSGIANIGQNQFYDDEYSAMYFNMQLWNAYYQNKVENLLKFATNDEIYKNATVTYPAMYRVCNKVAMLVFSELPRFTFDDKSQERLEYIIEKNKLFETLRLGQTEICGLGNVYLKINTDESKDYPIIELVRALDAAPTYVDWGKVTEATFYSLKSKEGNTYWWLAQTYTEIDGKKVIESRLYKGDSVTLGQERPLTDIEETADIAPVTDLKTKASWFVHVKSPMPNNKDPHSPLGMSIAANSLEQIDHINLTMHSYYKDDKLKQPKVVVTEDLVTSRKRGGQIEYTVNADDDYYILLNTQSDGSQLYKSLDLPSKQDSFEASIQGKLDRFYESCGLFRASIQKNSGVSGAKTATEWELADKDSSDTGADFKNAWYCALDELFHALLEIDNVYYQGADVTSKTKHDIKQNITIEFMDSVKYNQQEKAETSRGLYKDGMISLFTALQETFPDWDDERIQEEIDRRNAEAANRAKVTEVDFFGSREGE
jgi:A118 family predicted phage portal protein